MLGLLFLAMGASATTVGQVEGRVVSGRPLEVNIPFVLDKARDRACASANVRYGNMRVAGVIVDVQGSGPNRNLLVSSRAVVKEESVTIDARVGCGAKSVTRRFVLLTNLAPARNPPVARLRTRQDVPVVVAPRTPPKTVVLGAPREPLFPPPEAESPPAPEPVAPKVDGSMWQDLQKARTEAATATAQLESARKELAAVLDVERRSRQTLINSDNQAREAQSEVARMRLVLKGVAFVLALGAAGLVWWEFQRVASRMRRPNARPAQDPTILSMEAEPSPS
ncbi:hypothetical protein [Ramlibacter montanisoli]|uniref:Uncharacterized protein n=1 Tax=Ramlibacter montanisoli TaxID=2732512 RepID=A0A849KD00_9BURK|nr:hypothetical protein [Ramlibacter montanisoli]NNU42621.1 hypothetical protein [Ramlibacter montanisoli]